MCRVCGRELEHTVGEAETERTEEEPNDWRRSVTRGPYDYIITRPSSIGRFAKNKLTHQVLTLHPVLHTPYHPTEAHYYRESGLIPLSGP